MTSCFVCQHPSRNAHTLMSPSGRRLVLQANVHANSSLYLHRNVNEIILPPYFCTLTLTS